MGERQQNKVDLNTGCVNLKYEPSPYWQVAGASGGVSTIRVGPIPKVLKVRQWLEWKEMENLIKKQNLSVGEMGYDVDEFEPSLEIMTTYGTKKVNDKFYGVVKIGHQHVP